MTIRSLTRPVHEIPVEEIPNVRAALVAEADELLTRSEGDSLEGPDADMFRTIEQVIGTLDQRARVESRSAALDPRMEHLLATATGGFEHRDGPFRSPGLMPDLVRFSDEQLREAHAAAMEGRNHRVQLELETRDVSTSNVPMATIPGQRLDPLPIDRESVRIASLLPTDTVTSSTVSYYRQTTAATAAAPVAEGGAKPESSLAWEAESVTIRKLAHFVDVTKEALDDFANMRQLVTSEMNAGLIATENAQLLSGSGSGINIRGLLNATGILTYAPSSAEAWYRSIRTAIRDLRTDTALAQADTIVVHPDDAMVFDLSNDTTAGLHAVADLRGAPGAAPVWGLRRVETTGITAGTALVMDSRRAAVLFVREAPTLFVDPYSQSANNIVRVIVEERVGLGILNAACMIKITFNDTPEEP